jgi:putative transcription factor
MAKECELCGRQTDERYIATIENVELRVCTRCAKGRHVVPEPAPAGRRFSPSPAKAEAVVEIVEDYGNRVRTAREQMKIPVRVLAEMISEKEGVLTRVEQQTMVPPDALRKKLEHALKIRLAETTEAESATAYRAPGKVEEATLGDFIG